MEGRQGQLPEEKPVAPVGSKILTETAYITASRVWEWYNEAREKSSDFRIQSQTDCDYYDHDQWTEEERQELKERGQPDTTINRIKPAIDLVLGTESKLRVDFKAAPRKSDYTAEAGVSTQCIKYVMDQNEGEHLVSDAFKNQIIAGWKFIEIRKNEDPFGEVVELSEVPRDELLWDPRAMKYDLSDGKYMIRPKWVELEDAIIKFPKHKRILESSVSNPEIDYWKSTPYYGTEDKSDRSGVLSWGKEPNSTEWLNKGRALVKLLECWYKVNEKAWVVEFDTGETEELDPRRVIEIIQTPGAMISQKYIKKVRLCIVAGPYILQDVWSPHRHNQYPFIPFWGFVKDKDHSPYGLVRQMRDPQDEVNKRRSKAMHLLNSTQIIMSADSIDQKHNDIRKVAEQIVDPQGIIVLNSQAGPNSRFEVRNPMPLIEAQYKFEEEAKREIEEASVSREMKGLESNATSGRAIIARQIQGNTMLGPLFENYKRSRQLLGQQIWANIQQQWTKPKVIRITNDLGEHTFVELNKMEEIDGIVYVRNDITRAKIDIVIDQQTFNATVRQTLADEMLTLITKLPPEIGLLMLDDVVDCLDLPNKDRLMQKIQMVQGMMNQKMSVEQENQRMIAEAAKLKATGVANKNANQGGSVNRAPEEAAMVGGLS